MDFCWVSKVKSFPFHTPQCPIHQPPLYTRCPLHSALGILSEAKSKLGSLPFSFLPQEPPHRPLLQTLGPQVRKVGYIEGQGRGSEVIAVRAFLSIECRKNKQPCEV